jgi:phosphoserine phosphatase RsbU/P
MTSTGSIATDPYRGLIRVSCIINSIHDYHQLLTSLLEITKEVMNCAAGSLMLYDDKTNDLAWHIALGDKADKLKEMGRLKMGQGVAGWVAENRKSALVADTAHDERFFRGADTKTGFSTRSIICVPLLLDEKLVGVLQALNPLHKQFFDENDLEIFEAYGALAATAIEKIRWQEATLRQQKNEQELEIAQEIQSRFLVQSFPLAESLLQLGVYYQPAYQIGGDFYDVQEMPGGSFAVIVGDVTGKGVPAALLMAQLLSEFRYCAPRETDPGKILSRMSDSLSSRITRGMFATAWCAVIRPMGNWLETSQASAGHLAPLRHLNNGVESINLDSGLPLGIIPDVQYTSTPIALGTGEWICVYTDGITEGRNAEGVEFGTERLSQWVQSRSSNVIEAQDDLKQIITDFNKGVGQRDDITFLLIGPKQAVEKS